MPETSTQPRGLDVNIRSGPQAHEYRAIVDRIVADRPASILDWGCGFGQITALLTERGMDVTAYDYRPDVAEPRVEPLERFPGLEAHVSSEPVRLPFADDTFAAVLSLGVLEHVQNPDASLEELKRVLVPGGTLYVYKLPNRHSYLERIAKRAGLYYHGSLPHDRIYTLESARELLDRHGYAVTEARRANILPLTLPGRLATRFADGLWRTNVALAAVPGLNAIATNVELVARAPRRS
jgi:SAM-dependent methyltransferase